MDDGWEEPPMDDGWEEPPMDDTWEPEMPDEPMPVEPDGGIGSGAPPLMEDPADIIEDWSDFLGEE